MGRGTRTDAATGAVAAEIDYARRLLRRIGPTLLLVFACIALPLWSFGELAEEVLDGEPFAFDEPLLRAAHALATPELDTLFVAISAIGFGWGVIPADILLVLGLTLRRRLGEASYAAIATGGSGLLNFAAKHTFERERPALWTSVAPEATYSFPSGHAMASATFACVVTVLCWRSPARPAVFAVASLFVLAVGVSRVYLGVHYPSDVLAGWMAAVAWALGVHLVMSGGRRLRRGRRRA